jgi:hypothetical protein
MYRSLSTICNKELLIQFGWQMRDKHPQRCDNIERDAIDPAARCLTGPLHQAALTGGFSRVSVLLGLPWVALTCGQARRGWGQAEGASSGRAGRGPSGRVCRVRWGEWGFSQFPLRLTRSLPHVGPWVPARASEVAPHFAGFGPPAHPSVASRGIRTLAKRLHWSGAGVSKQGQIR